MAPQRHVGWEAAGVFAPPHMTWHPGVVPGAAPQSSPSPGPILVATLCSTSSSLFAKHLRPLLTIPSAPVDVFQDACQHSAPLAIPRQLWSTSYEQGPIVYGPSEALKVAGVIEVYCDMASGTPCFSTHPRHSVQCSVARLRISYATTNFSSTPLWCFT